MDKRYFWLLEYLTAVKADILNEFRHTLLASKRRVLLCLIGGEGGTQS